MAFTPDEVEDGYGLPGALVYEQTEAAVAWLVRRGMTNLRDLETEEERDTALLRATEAAENAVRSRLRCTPVTSGQGLLFPATGAYDYTGRLALEDERPSPYMQGIRLLAEAIAAGRFMPHAGSTPGVEREYSRQGGIDYARGTNLSTLAANHPEEWRLIASVIPPV